MSIKIKDLPINDRPRERLINKGVQSLSDEELLSIVLKTGTKDVSAKVLAMELLKKIGTIQNLKNIGFHALTQIKGIGTAKACLILAIQELNRRMNIKQDKIVDVKITTPEVVYDYYKNIVNEYQEYFYCLYLDSNKKVLSEKLLFMGTVNESMVHPRDVFKEAYLVNATAIICVHNHPTGDVRPSKEDVIVTDRLNEIGYLMGIKLVDHVIVSKNKYYSFLENGKI
ncbi:MAG: DNA repair protein RadC [Bacilli bacterium]|nr:DNA repair protein RadC [Bacilli bacterium]